MTSKHQRPRREKSSSASGNESYTMWRSIITAVSREGKLIRGRIVAGSRRYLEVLATGNSEDVDKIERKLKGSG